MAEQLGEGLNALDRHEVETVLAIDEPGGGKDVQVWVEHEVVAEGLHGGEPGELTVGTALTEIVPLHSLMAEKIEALRQWSRGRARHASHRDSPANGKRKLDL